MSALLGTPFQLGQCIQFDHGSREGNFGKPISRSILQYGDMYQAGARHGDRMIASPTTCSSVLTHGWLTYAPLSLQCRSKRALPRRSIAQSTISSPARDHATPAVSPPWQKVKCYALSALELYSHGSLVNHSVSHFVGRPWPRPWPRRV